MNDKPVIIAVTGGIGSGKNTVGDYFARLGAAVIDSDEVVHTLYENDQHLRRDIMTVFGPSIIDAHGKIDRKKLASAVFGDEKNRDRLNRIVHPKVRQEIHNRIESLSQTDKPACIVVLVPLLIEANMVEDFDKVVLVTADEQIRLLRVKQRSGLSEKEIKARMHAQMPDEEKKRYADYIIDNNETLEHTNNQIEHIYNELTQQIHHKPAHQVDLMEG